MNTTQIAYINGFVKRANEYGYSDNQAIELLKQANPGYYEQQGANLGSTAGRFMEATSPDYVRRALEGTDYHVGDGVKRLGGILGKGVDRGLNAAGNFVANHPSLHQGLENYSNNYNTAMDATKGPSTSLLRPALRPIAANMAAAHEAINPAVR